VVTYAASRLVREILVLLSGGTAPHSMTAWRKTIKPRPFATAWAETLRQLY